MCSLAAGRWLSPPPLLSARGAMTGVLLLMFGSAAKDDDLEAFLAEILGRAPTRAQVEDLRRRYSRIGWSPLVEITTDLAKKLADSLGDGFTVAVGARHGSPAIALGIEELVQRGAERILAVTLAPQESPDSARYVQSVQESLACLGEKAPEVVFVTAWWERPDFITALGERLRSFIRSHNPAADTVFMFTAHSLPSSMQGAGRYVDQLLATAWKVAGCAGVDSRLCQLVFQSRGRFGRAEWLGPGLLEQIELAGSQGVKQIVVVPVQFLCDHLEVLYDIDVQARELATAMGVSLLRPPMFNSDGDLVAVLSALVREGATAVA